MPSSDVRPAKSARSRGPPLEACASQWWVVEEAIYEMISAELTLRPSNAATHYRRPGMVATCGDLQAGSNDTPVNRFRM